MTITCCLAPSGHAAYCITRSPKAAVRVGPGAFGGWSDETVVRMMHKQADLCVRVMQMPEAERTAPGPKGAASPEQAASLNAMIAIRLEQEARERGLL